mgnify:CR=1 FL=1
MWRPFPCRPALFITFFLVNARGCHFLGSKPIDSSYLSARLFARLPLYPLAASFGLFCSERLFACVDSAPWRYLLIRLLAMFLLLFGAERLCSHFKKGKIIIIIYRTSRCYRYMILFYSIRPLTAIFGLAASPPHGNRFSIRLTAKSIFYSASRRMSIYFSLAASRRNRFSIRLTANVDFIFLTPPHGEIDFLFASRRNRFSICLTANVDFLFSIRLTAKSISIQPHGECRFYFTLADSRRNRFSIHLTANVDFISLHGVDQFSLRLTARTNFIPPTRCFVPHGGNQCSLSLMARLGLCA